METENNNYLPNEIRSIYTSLEDAREEVWNRWNNHSLKARVQEFLSDDIPDFLMDSPKAYLAKHIVSPNLNFFHYLDSVKLIDLEPAMPEYRIDKFVTSNKDKYHLGKIYTSSDKGKRGGVQISTRLIIDMQSADGKRFCDIKTVYGGEFIDFHHFLIDALAPGYKKYIYDVSDWMRRHGRNSEDFYLYFFALFICNGVLFENFLNKQGKYDEFNKAVVIPSFKKITDIFGVSPLVVPTVPFEIECDTPLWYYPKETERVIDESFQIK